MLGGAAVHVIENPLRSVCLKGTLLERENSFTISVQLPINYCDVRVGNWAICIQDLSYNSYKLPLGFHENLTISTNFVEGKRYNRNRQIENFFPSLQRCEIKGQEKKLVSFDKTWFDVNFQTDLLSLKFDFCPAFLPSTLFELDITVTVLLRRMN